MTTKLQALIESLGTVQGVVFDNESVVWAEQCGEGAPRELLAYLERTGDRMGALSVLAAISRACDSEFPTDQPLPDAHVKLPDGRIRYGDPAATPSQLMPDRFSHLEDIFRELRGG